ncbi:PTS sugar transporter subunit IIA [Sulfuriferula thiophila]|uniref:PTS sugar transporter subunit IIA n=1 Tax=Sulfuriferula thiophila TaxID=1781211 RepID=UPI000F60F1C4|nr:PTS sugar transporter subunit IIA [Sulfuriferula thiophila]
MNQIAPLLSVSNILLDVEMGSKKRLFEYVGQLFGSELGVVPQVILDSLIAREKLGSTGLGQGIAIPHGRIKGLKSAMGVFVRLNPSIDFDAPDQLPVKLVFILFVPMQATDLHLQILGELAQLFSNKSLRDALMTSVDSDSVLNLIRNWQP